VAARWMLPTRGAAAAAAVGTAVSAWRTVAAGDNFLSRRLHRHHRWSCLGTGNWPPGRVW